MSFGAGVATGAVLLLAVEIVAVVIAAAHAVKAWRRNRWPVGGDDE